MTPPPVRLAEALEAYIAELAIATPAQRDQLAALLAPSDTPGSESPSAVTSAGTASHGLSAGARPHTRPETPHVPSQRDHRALRRPAFRATPRATS